MFRTNDARGSNIQRVRTEFMMRIKK